MPRSLLLLLLLSGCAKGIPLPGPLAPLRHPPRTVPASPRAAAPQAPAAERPFPAPAPSAGKPPRSTREGSALAKAAQHYLTSRPPSRFRDDCSGFVEASADRAGLDLTGNTALLWTAAEAAGATHTAPLPARGDLAFFDNTFDRNRNGRRDDQLTHVAVVLDVLPDGTITLAHAGTSKGRSTLMMNLLQPDEHLSSAGTVLNSFLRRRSRNEPEHAAVLSGQLWRGFAHPW